MEKKGNRSVQPLSTKGPATDSKKSQDVNKQWPRGGRRREPNAGAFPKLCEGTRKPVPQRNKNLDKRPRPRGFYNAEAVGGKEEPGLEPEVEAELGSVFLQGSKKQSLNHLLNFHFEPRDGGHGNSSPAKGGYRWNAIAKHKYNKEQFLQANCQFVVQESGDYQAYMNNPDALVDWSLVEQVNLQVLEFPSCPICLYPPVAAKMTRCGHIYCWSCLLHYLALSDKTWRKCPICFEAVHKNDLKSVFTEPHTPFNINEEITFKLMKRYKGSLISYPADYEVHEDKILNMSDKNISIIYSKLLLAGKSEIASIIARERVQLLAQLSEDEHCPERCFIEQALALLQERETGIHNVYNFEATEELNGNKTVLLDDSDITSKKCHFFYQASDGQHIYLHPLNVRMVEHTYGSLEHCPPTITGQILEKEAASVTDELRKRLRYLQHLPVTCTFEVAEIVITPPLISPDTFSYFQEQIETRRKRRQRRARDEKRREKKITEEENKKIGRYPIPDIKLESQYQFPDFQTSSIATVENETPPMSETPTPNSSVSGSLNADNEYAGLSFAKMLAANKASPAPAWPTRKTTSETAVFINSNNARPQMNSNLNFDDHIPAPAFNHSFGDAIALALEKVTLTESEGQGKSSAKKKKKKEKKILFATSMAYSTH